MIESSPGAGGTTVLHMSMPWPAPQWVRYIFFITPPILIWAFAVGSITLLYRFFRGRPLPNDTENTRCGWCQHELRGITMPVCSECGHRIGDQGPDEDGNVPQSRRWSRRVTGWITYPLVALAITGIVKLAASAVIIGIVFAFHLSTKVDREQNYVFAFLVLFIGLTFGLAIYEGLIQLDLTHSGRAWCRACKSELKDLTEPVSRPAERESECRNGPNLIVKTLNRDVLQKDLALQIRSISTVWRATASLLRKITSALKGRSAHMLRAAHDRCCR